MENFKINGAMLERYYHLSKMKKEIESELTQLKDNFNLYFDSTVGENAKGEFTDSGFKLQRQIQKTEKFNEALTLKKLEELRMKDLIETVRRPDTTKIHAALELGLLREDQVEDLRVKNYSQAIVVKEV